MTDEQAKAIRWGIWAASDDGVYLEGEPIDELAKAFDELRTKAGKLEWAIAEIERLEGELAFVYGEGRRK